MAQYASSSFISICSWNVGGLISKSNNKLNDHRFIQEIQSYDIVFLSETHTGFDTLILKDFNIFQYVDLCRVIIGIMWFSITNTEVIRQKKKKKMYVCFRFQL